MKRALTIVCTTIFAATVAKAQDFASKYMLENQQDTILHCISVGPKMMEEVLKIDTQDEDQEDMRHIISNLKSMQIISSPINGELYFNKAEEIVEKNANRFTSFLSYDDENENCRILIRKKKRIIIELVMFSQKEEHFQVINFTGNMNNEFIDKLAKAMIPGKPEEE